MCVCVCVCVGGVCRPAYHLSRSARNGGYRLSWLNHRGVRAKCTVQVVRHGSQAAALRRKRLHGLSARKLGLLFSHAKNEAYCPFCFLFLRAFATHAQCHVYSAVRFGRENTMSAFLAQCALSLHAIVCIFSAVRFELAGFQRSAL